MKINFNYMYNPIFKGNKYVIGHKNPDTDSICSAIAYSELGEKTKLNSDDKYIPLSAGDINKETEFALAYFGIQPPKIAHDLSLTVSDVYKDVPLEDFSVKTDTSVRELYNLIYSNNLEEVPVTDENNELVGIITPKEIMKFNLSTFDMLKVLRYKNIPLEKLRQILDAKVLVGEEHMNETLKGSVNMGVYSRSTTKTIELENAMVLVGDREDIQEEVMNQGAKVLVITKNKYPSEKILNLAREKGIIILLTKRGTSSSAKLLEQSTPVVDLMNKNVLSFDVKNTIDSIKEKAKTSYHQVFPVTENGKLVGRITLDEILNPKEKEMILVDHNSPSQFAEGIKRENVKEIVDHHRQEFIAPDSRMPAQYSLVGATATLVAKNYKANSVEIPKGIAGILWSAIVSDTDNFSSVTTTPEDIKIASELAKIAGIDDTSELALKLLEQRDAALNELSPKELINYDKKVFEETYSISQISTFRSDKYVERQEELQDCLCKNDSNLKLSGSFLMISDTGTKETCLLASDNFRIFADRILRDSDEKFMSQAITGTNLKYGDILTQIVVSGYAKLPNVMSRKEQVDPFLKRCFSHK